MCYIPTQQTNATNQRNKPTQYKNECTGISRSLNPKARRFNRANQALKSTVAARYRNISI